MKYHDLRDFIAQLERMGELKRIAVEVDPHLEMTEICDRVLRAGGPAILFEKPKGSAIPVLANLFGTPQRVALGMGENTKSMLITRALAEMTRFAVSQGANPMTFLGLAGVGDLIVTCSSPKSRNYQVGFALGQGLSLEDAVTRLGEVAEGVNTLKVLKAKAQEVGVYMPLVAGLHAILFEGRTLNQVIELLMRAEPKTDVDFISTSGFN